MIFLIALVAATGAAAAPLFYRASTISILRDAAASAELGNRDFNVTLTGAVRGGDADIVAATAAADLASALGGRAEASRILAPPIRSVEGTAPLGPGAGSVPVVWRTGLCQHVRIVSGACPARAGQVLISASAVRMAGWRQGQRLRLPGWGPLTIAGIYEPGDIFADYWSNRGKFYFPAEFPVVAGPALPVNQFDAMFTVPGTMRQADPATQGTMVFDQAIAPGQLRVGDVPALYRAADAVTRDQMLAMRNAIVTTNVAATLDQIRASWTALAILVTLIAAQLLALCWLLLFLTVTDAVEARGPELALARVRGKNTTGTLAFGLAEPVALLLAGTVTAVPVAWALTGWLGGLVLRPGTPAALTWAGVAVAAGSAVGGLAAIVLAARKVVRRPVLEQWRRSGRRAADRGWVADAVLLTGCVGGLIDLTASGSIASARGQLLPLLVPGLLGLAVAVIASRLLPMTCRFLIPRLRGRGGIGQYLALRTIARRPGGARITMTLATAFALYAFSVSAWLVFRANYQLVAGAQIGAPVVATVVPPAGGDLAAIVRRIDPAGSQAMVVDSYPILNGAAAGVTMLGVDPDRYRKIAYWRPDFAGQPLGALTAQLAPPAPAPLVLSGERIRVVVTVAALDSPGAVLEANVTSGSSPVVLGRLPSRGTVTLTGELTGCPCVLSSLEIAPPFGAVKGLTGLITIQGLLQSRGGHWVPAGGGQALTQAGAWRAEDTTQNQLTIGSWGLTWPLRTQIAHNAGTAVIDSVNRPDPLPALGAAGLIQGRSGDFASQAFDGSPLTLRLIAPVRLVPGVPSSGVVVDRRYAELAGGLNLTAVQRQVWATVGGWPRIEAALRGAGVRIVSLRRADQVAAELNRQGPALATLLFLAYAGAAVLLGSAAAVLGLAVTARRRQFEYAALLATGVPARALRRSVRGELAALLGFAALAGLAAGLVATVLTLRVIPEFATGQVALSLTYRPPRGELAIALGGAVLLLGLVAAAAARSVLAGVRLDQLREAQASARRSSPASKWCRSTARRDRRSPRCAASTW